MDDIFRHGYYINLEHRTDRKTHVEGQLKTLGVSLERFNAIRMNNGAIGCTMSHLKCLQQAKVNNWEYTVIVEDDITFTKTELFKTQLDKFLKSGIHWDVILLAGNNVPPYEKHGDFCIKVSKCQTTTGYIVKQSYIDTLIENFKTGLNLLLRFPDKHILYAIDKYWFQLQQKDKWFLIIPPTVIQRPDYSDIEEKHTNYTSVMTDIDKTKYMPKFLNLQKI